MTHIFPTGIEPVFLAWKANVLPLDEGNGNQHPLKCSKNVIIIIIE